MKPATTAAKNTIQREHAVAVQPRLTAEWEYNRFRVPQVTVFPAQFDPDWIAAFGDVQSVAQPNRPRTGIAKIRLDAGVKPLGASRDTPQASRFYPAGPTDPYKYFGSEQVTKLVQNADGSYDFDAPIQIAVVYDEPVVTNKIVLGFETSYAKPVDYTVEYTLDGNSWFPAATNVALESDGTATLYRGRTGWDIARNLDYPAVIQGVRLNVYSMNQPYAHVDVLQVGARLENDLTPYLISYSVQMEVADRSFLAPLGKASANKAKVKLSNIDGRFNNHNTASLYKGMIDKKIKFTLDLGIDATPQSGSKYEYVREFTMWTDTWGVEGQTTVDVDLQDSSIFLQEENMPVVFYENTAAGAVVWQIMDYLGHTNYAYSRAAQDYGQIIPFYWPEKDNTVWKEFASIAEATQTAIFYDENDVLQIRARAAMYSDKAVDWNFDAVSNGQKLPDVIDMEIGYDLESNSVDVKYQPAHYSDSSNGIPKMETVWDAEEETILLRASTMSQNLLIGGTDLWVAQATANFWPYHSDINIEGEILAYIGKEYAYYTLQTGNYIIVGGDMVVPGPDTHVLNKKVIYSLEEQQQLDKLDEFYSWKNSYTGRLVVTERGKYGSLEDNHYSQVTSYMSYVANGDHPTYYYDWSAGGQSQQDGFVRLTNNSTAANTYHVLKHPMKLDLSAKTAYFGTRMRFSNESACWIAGLHIAGDDGRGGYNFEFSPTTTVEAESRTHHNEVSLSQMPTGGTYSWVPEFDATDGVGYQFGMLTQEWYDIDAKWEKLSNGDVNISLFVNSVYTGRWLIPAAQVLPTTGRFGIFVRGTAEADFEYLYGVVDDEANPFLDPDATGFLDLERGGYMSGFVQKNIRYNFGTVTPAYQWAAGGTYYPQRVQNNRFAFDEFGPVVHEVRKFDVKFKEENVPVAHSNLYFNNPEQIDVTYYESDAFGASFLLANAARHDAFAKGDDGITFGKDNIKTRTMFIYGRSVYQDEERTKTTDDASSIRRRGMTKTEFSNRLVQTEEMADGLGQWILDLWASGVDEVTLNVFGNPFIQLGDLVTINYPIKDMFPTTHKYFIVSIDNEFDGGYKTKVVLRRARV
jgi:hypothetical protein